MTGTAWTLRVRRALAALLLFVSFGGIATAAGWTIQTVALRDFRDAQTTVDDLRGFGLDAYSEFAMWEGEQFVRVRFGCFFSREIAEEMAVRVRTSFIDDAVPVERTPGAPTDGCLEEGTGFLKPANWRQLGEGVPAFEVMVGETTAVVRHTGRRWRVSQADEPLPPLGPPSEPRFSQGLLLDIAVVETVRGEFSLVVCPGRMLAEIGDVVIVDRGDRIVSCRLRQPAAVASTD